MEGDYRRPRCYFFVASTENNSMTFTLQRILERTRNEKGLVLIELITVMVILSVLTTIAIPTYGHLQRKAVLASVKSDIRSSAAILVKELDTDGFFVTDEYFSSNAAISGDNNLVLMVSGTGMEQVACIWGSHAFNENDIVSYHYSSATGTIGEGSCLSSTPDDSTVIVGSGPGTSDPTADEHEEETTEPAPVVVPTPQPTSAPAPTPTTPTSAPSPQPSSSPTVAPAPVVPTPTATPKPQPVEPTYSSSKNKYPVCHASGGKWHLLMLPYSGLINGHAGHGSDVIPPIAGKYAGHNWNASGWETFRTYCS
jgi:prepilin-type N-terminal cleavage/methylation domain-containing protein